MNLDLQVENPNPSGLRPIPVPVRTTITNNPKDWGTLGATKPRLYDGALINESQMYFA